MRLVTYDRGDTPRAGLLVGGMVADLERASRALIKTKLPISVRALLAAGAGPMRDAARTTKKVAALVKKIEDGKQRRPVWIHAESDVHLGPPIPDPEKVICIGLNYKCHCREQEGRFGRSIEPPPNPIIFAKFASTLTGPYDPIRLPAKKITAQVDFECELAIVIGREAHKVKRRDALNYVAGYMVMNDVSARDCQFSDKQWVRAKSFDTFGPCGPCLVTTDEIPDPNRLCIWTAVDGETLQNSSTREQIFKVPQVIAFLTQAMTLRPGDIISTGTPAGVGVFRDPPILLHPGATVECGIESIGTIVNTCERA